MNNGYERTFQNFIKKEMRGLMDEIINSPFN